MAEGVNLRYDIAKEFSWDGNREGGQHVEFVCGTAVQHTEVYIFKIYFRVFACESNGHIASVSVILNWELLSLSRDDIILSIVWLRPMLFPGRVCLIGIWRDVSMSVETFK